MTSLLPVLALASLAIGLLLAFRGHRIFPGRLNQWEAGVAGALFVAAGLLPGPGGVICGSSCDCHRAYEH